MAYAKSWFFTFGLTEYARKSAPKTSPIPTPAPIKPEQAAPAPTAFKPIITAVVINVKMIYLTKADNCIKNFHMNDDGG